ncbi:hypothetical protein PR003_g21623 [Phytophthora rubi]|uniref:Secreted peptide n=1 Tax=Phytophthora rubi TaxID=129364 RepID=A0A6A3IUW3_9STRA|nr:hypothetical protein PR002_g22610 [Phytophthora rubi]KAE8988411.1 hypothetical protein PR001_g22046 [Phytophthora rubi]KAE9304945.1 hypothetical protein PR003_g21623 [Phytophthora rubi]
MIAMVAIGAVALILPVAEQHDTNDDIGAVALLLLVAELHEQHDRNGRSSTATSRAAYTIDGSSTATTCTRVAL